MLMLTKSSYFHRYVSLLRNVNESIIFSKILSFFSLRPPSHKNNQVSMSNDDEGKVEEKKTEMKCKE